MPSPHHNVMHILLEYSLKDWVEFDHAVTHPGVYSCNIVFTAASLCMKLGSIRIASFSSKSYILSTISDMYIFIHQNGSIKRKQIHTLKYTINKKEKQK